MKTIFICLSVSLAAILTLLTFTGGTSPDSVEYQFVFPKHHAVVTKENVMSTVIEINQEKIASVKMFMPWDTTLLLTIPNSSDAEKYLAQALQTFPRTLLAQKSLFICTPYHLPADTVTVDHQFEGRTTSYALLMADSSQKEYKALRRFENRVRVELQGWQPVTSVLAGRKEFCQGKYFAFTSRLVPGKNQIPIEFYSSANALIAKDSVIAFYDLELSSANLPDGITKQAFHTTANAVQACRQCHASDPQKASSELLCGTCHTGFAKQQFVHGPLSANDCSSCHQEADKGFALSYSSESENQSCITCHDNVDKDLKEKKNIHAPLAGGQCSICHSPHASPYPAQLRKSINDVCLSCHENHREANHPVMFHPNRDVPDMHNPGKNLSCTSCHHPHASDNASLLNAPGGYFALCQQCHNK